MAITKVVNSNASIGRAINYVTKEEKTEAMLISGMECSPETAIDEMKATKELWNKTDGRQYKHYVHSFAPGESITHEKAHEIAKELCKERFKGYEVLIATHKDREHIHSHIIVNSVSYENGYKLQQSKKDLAEMKSHSNELCKEHGLSVPQKGKTFEGKDRTEMTSFNKDKYQLLLRAEKGDVKSYVLDTAIAVVKSKQQAVSREDFINKMAEKGYEINWKDNHKHITFTDKEGQKVRNSNIEKTFKVNVSKEELEHGFEQNRGRDNRGRTEIGRAENTANITRTDNPINRANSISKNEPIGSRVDESGKPTVKTNVEELYGQLHGIRGLDKKFNPKEQRKRREQSEHDKQIAESKARELAKQQRALKSKSKEHVPEL